ncbi:ABC transporter ATP-binding protein [Corynebacterium diphtheriae]|nr:ATP-binding cassette domain-containing protein [Corynebacterium diphtheriae]CAB0527909.1 ABC transporter ATP-binding protein [Corynebacterium diphtheriae]CAB0555398.1 ABC transporter ATP-binding protein [Corynebacterium diphtheriae]CAB0569270.1 ABC transporter ATP-binding protein [Corynebacterium diphtheriae]CAB0622786.1 ABC transporter ATP-binding protein [Corynebacterium diphtheriae]CAB0660879.1 ABC transporter ATP-binding protein [Corynebacterium diphtheriae]
MLYLIHHRNTSRQHCSRLAKTFLLRLGILGDFGLEDIDRILDRTPRELSGGQRRRVSVAAAVAADPELLIIDEPTAGVDTPPWS